MGEDNPVRAVDVFVDELDLAKLGLLMTMIAYAFLQHRRLAASGAEKKNQRASTSAKLAGGTPRYRRPHSSTANSAMPILQKTNP